MTAPTSDVVAVTGASGRLGGRVARGLAGLGVPLRLVGRDPSRLPTLPGAELAPAAAYGDARAMRAALEGAGTLFLVSAHEAADRVREHIAAVDAAVAAGVERIVYVSFQGAAPDATFTFARDHWHTEQHLATTAVRATFLRDSFYFADLAGMAGADGVLRGPAGDGRVAAVAHDDIADVAVAVLTGVSTARDGYDVTGPHALTLADVAEELSRVSGRTVRYVPESRDEAYASRAGSGAPDWEVAGWVTSYEAIAAGEMSAVSDTVPRLTGHQAQPFADFLATNPDTWHHLVATS